MDRGAPTHAFLDHVSESILVVRAASLADLFAEAARGLAELEARAARLGPAGDWETVSVEAPDRAALLVEWLNELIWRAERAAAVPCDVEVLEVGDRALTARVRWAQLEETPALVKAATMHGLRLEECDGVLEAAVTLDV